MTLIFLDRLFSPCSIYVFAVVIHNSNWLLRNRWMHTYVTITRLYLSYITAASHFEYGVCALVYSVSTTFVIGKNIGLGSTVGVPASSELSLKILVELFDNNKRRSRV